MAIINYDPKTGRKLKEGESTTDPQGRIITQGQEFKADDTNFGAAGRGEFMDQNFQDTKEASGFGVPMSEVGDFQRDPNYKIPKPTPTLNRAESLGVADEYGLKNISDEDFSGLTRVQARAKAQAKKDALLNNTSALTTYTYDPKVIAGFKSKLGDVKFSIDQMNNDPWINKDEKNDKKKSILSSYSSQLAGLFGNVDDFNKAATSPELQKYLKEFEQMGGTVSDIASKITKPATASIDGAIESPYVSSGGDQSLDTYLGAMKTSSDERALESLVPEKEVYQQQIAQQQGIPEQYKDLYFGTPEQVGLIQQRRQQAQDEVKLLERRAKLDEKNMRAQADFAIEKNNKEMDIEADTIEENRLAAKNYMTGMLAKLGALNTTGAAPQAIATLEQKYTAQAQKLRTSYKFANREIELKLNENVDSIQLDRDQKILDAKADLSKSEEDVWKEVFKLQNEADAKTLSTIEKYTQEFRTQRDKFTKEAKAEAEKSAKAYQKLASLYDVNSVNSMVSGEGSYTTRGKEKGIVQPDGSIKPFSLTPALAQEVRNAGVAGEDAIVFFTSTEPAFRDYLVTSNLTGLNRDQLQKEYTKWKAEKDKKTAKGREV